MNIEWTKRDLADLGKVSDQALANRMKVSAETVRIKRQELEIPPYQQKIESPWLPAEIAMLGSMTDKAVAAKLGRSVETVAQARIARKIPVFREKPLITWTTEDIKELGVLQDLAIAERKGISKGTVALKRKELGIAAAGPTALSEVEVSKLGTMPDADLAKELNRPLRAIKAARLRRGIAAYTIPVKNNYAVVARSGLQLSWTEAAELDQRTFFTMLANAYLAKTGKRLTRLKLSKLSHWKQEQLTSWFTSKKDIEFLPLTARHHLWLAVAAVI